MVYHLRGQEYFSKTGMPLAVFRTKADDRLEMHTHDFYELVVVSAGYGRHHINGNNYPIAAGDVFVILSGSEHTYEDCKQLEIYNVLFDISKLNLPASSALKYRIIHYRFPTACNPHRYARSRSISQKRLQQQLGNYCRLYGVGRIRPTPPPVHRSHGYAFQADHRLLYERRPKAFPFWRNILVREDGRP